MEADGFVQCCTLIVVPAAVVLDCTVKTLQTAVEYLVK